MVARLLNGSHPLGQLRDDMDQLFDRVFKGLPQTQAGWVSPVAFPAVNLWEDEKCIYAEAELPGLEMDDIEVSIVGTELTLKGVRKSGSEDGATYHRRERGAGTFCRVLDLPVDVETETVEASLHNGVLLITLPKAAAARPRKVEVRSLQG